MLSDVDAEDNDAEQNEAGCGVRRHPAGMLGEDVGGEQCVDPEVSSSYVLIEDGGGEEDDKNSNGAADECDTRGELWIGEGETAYAEESAEGGIGLHQSPADRQKMRYRGV